MPEDEDDDDDEDDFVGDIRPVPNHDVIQRNGVHRQAVNAGK